MVRSCSVIVLAAGQGTRMRSATPKPLFDVCGRTSIEHVLRGAEAIHADRIVVVAGAGNRDVIERAVAGRAVSVVTQEPLLGTGHAVRIAFDAVRSAAPQAHDDLVVLYADGPLYRGASLAALVDEHRRSGAAQTVLTAEVRNPTGYGRIVRDARGALERIVEEGDADDATRAIREVNTGVCALTREAAQHALPRLTNTNSKREYYLTDVVGLLRSAGSIVATSRLADANEARSFNTIAELAEVRRLMRARLVREHQDTGVDIVDPDTTFIDSDVTIGAGTRILPCSVIAARVRIGRDCAIGPFAHLRSGTVLNDGAEIGNFVESKNAVLGDHAKAKHLTYLGDATIGARANVGAGTITANYDGRAKHKTSIGAGAFIGSGTVLVAPVDVGDRATTGAGAVVLRNTKIGAGEVFVGVPARRLDKGRDA